MTSVKSSSLKASLVFLVVAAAVIGFLFHDSFRPGWAQFSNDGPLGSSMMRSLDMPAAIMDGIWYDLFWVGSYGGQFSSSPWAALFWFLGPVGFAKFYPLFAVLFLALAGWVLFVEMKLPKLAAGVAALAIALNSNIFSNVCWGLGTRAFCVGYFFIAIAALWDWSGRWKLVRVLIAGLSTGLAVVEGADNGAIFSIAVAAFVVFKALNDHGISGKAFGQGAWRLALVVVCAGWMAAQTLSGLISTGAVGGGGNQAKEMAPEQRWDWATQWSLPKMETLRVVVPGLFGYRMDTPDGGQYWGDVGRQPGYEQHGQGFSRHSGAGEYAGVLAVLIAAFGVANGFRKKGSGPFADGEKRMIRFWVVLAVVSVLLSWGRHAPFYQLVYALPYFSSIRNPMKFMHPFHAILAILMAFGLLAMSRLYLGTVASSTTGALDRLQGWWKKANPFERRWTYGLGATLAAGILGLLMFSASETSIVGALNSDYSREGADPALARAAFGFAKMEIVVALLIGAISIAAFLLIQAKVFAGNRAKWAWIFLGVILVVDLSRANAPWIKHYNYQEKYASNTLLDFLRQKPWEARVRMPSLGVNDQYQMLLRFYQVEWLQHQFPFYNIQSLDVAQDPRPPADKTEFIEAVVPRAKTPNSPQPSDSIRLWELTGARFIFGLAPKDFENAMNTQFDGGKAAGRIRVHTPFILGQAGPGAPITLQTNATGPFALLEFTGALPRAKLYSKWEVLPETTNALARLAAADFDSAASVVLASKPGIEAAAAGDAGTVKIDAYSPRRITLSADAKTPAVLLLNDHFDPNWKATVDGKPVEILKANHLMRGIALAPGAHKIEFALKPNSTPLYVTLAAQGLGLILLGVLVFGPGKRDEETPAEPVKPAPGKEK